MKSEDDDALRAALAAAHRGDAAHTPPFHQVWGAARPIRGRHSPVPWLVTCVSLAAALGLAAWLVGRLGPPPAQLPTGTSWIGPTDFLLDTPDMVTLRTIPVFVPSTGELSPEPSRRRGNP
jgi:hypothetical protein